MTPWTLSFGVGRLAFMPAAEPERHALYSRLENVLGPEHADTLITYLPGDTGDQVATKGDIARLEARIDSLQITILDQQKFYTRNTGSMAALTAVFSLVVAFLG